MSGMRPCHVVSSEHGVFCERGIYIRVGRLTLTYMVVMNDRLCVFQELKYKAIESYTSLPLASWVESSRVSYGAHGLRRARRREIVYEGSGARPPWLSQPTSRKAVKRPMSRSRSCRTIEQLD